MKVEAKCDNVGCATYGTLQLVKVDKLVKMYEVTGSHLRGEDEDGNAVECGFCGDPLTYVRLSSDSAQFPLGETHITSLAKNLLSAGSDEPLAHAQQAAEFVACHVFHTPGRSLLVEFGEAVELPAGQIVTQHVYDGETLWTVTNKERTKTTLMLAREYSGSEFDVG